ncbi:MAG: hypothetical protein WBL21_00180 [Salinimicrobium sp.]
MKLLPNEEKLSLLKSPQLYLTNQRIIHDGNSYGSINLKDITLVKTQHHANYDPVVVGAILALISFPFGEPYFYYGIGVLVLCVAYFVSKRFTTLDIHAPGSGSISVRVNYVDKNTIREFIYKIETEMERVKNGEKMPVL